MRISDWSSDVCSSDLSRIVCFGAEADDTRMFEETADQAAHLIYKVLWSALANAENNEGADADDLKVASIFVDEGPALKRFAARAKGRGTRIIKRTSHITVVEIGRAHV